MKPHLTVLCMCIILFSVLEVPMGHAADEPDLPDLIVTDLWQEGTYVYYQIMNIGNGSAIGTHVDAFFIDNIKTAENSIDRSLKPEERYEGMFTFTPTPGNPDVQQPPLAFDVKITTDFFNSIAESNETNNSLEKTWKPDLTPPAFLTKPTVNGITETSAVISWLTDKDSDSLVEYGTISGKYDYSAANEALATAHNVTLTELEASTTYHFKVQSTDQSGNTALSGENTFETMAVPDYGVPTLSIAAIPSVIKGRVNIQADASDDVGMEKVEFSLDGQLVFTAYSPPYALQLDTSEYDNGPHRLTVKAFDLAGNPTSEDKTFDVSNLQDKTIPLVLFSYPKDDDIVSGIFDIQVDVIDDVGLDSARFYVNGSYTEFDYLGGKQSTWLKYTYDARNLVNGTELSLAVQATDTSSNIGTGLIRVFVYNEEPKPPPHPVLEITQHTVVRSNNLFTITLGIENTGDARAYDVKILDAMKGFQPISADLPEATYSADGNPNGELAVMFIKPKLINMDSGESHVYVFYAVPVLSTALVTPEIGHYINLIWKDSLVQNAQEYSTFLQTPIAKTTNGETITQAHAEAVKTCDYLMVTNPYELYAYYDPAYNSEYIVSPSQNRTDVNNLLSTMAELARYEQGTIGYFTWLGAWPNQILRNLIQQGGSWSSKLTDDWTSNGYLLIVGENQIIPTWQRYVGTFKTTEGDEAYNVFTDYPYASTYGEEEIPELSIARIIGNSPKELVTVIRTSIDVYLGQPDHQFDRSDILAISGFPGSPPNVIDFKAVRDAVLKEITQKTPSVLQHTDHTPDYVVYNATGIDWPATGDLVQKTVLGETQDKDIIFFAGHGGYNIWDQVSTYDVMAKPDPFGDASPFVFASSCNTGTYIGVFGFAESILQKGAAVYLGATSISLGSGEYTSVKFFDCWDTNEPVSTAVKQTKIALGNGGVDKVWKAIYHVYGDAKFGATKTTSAYSALFSSQLSETLPPTTIDVTIPDYTVTQVGGKDYVEIPGGLQLQEPDMPAVPYYKVLYEYPKGYRIQDVALTYRSQPVSQTSLNIPNTVLAIPENGVMALLQSQATPEWYPNKDFEWTVYEGPDRSTLAITIYPFNYNPSTTDANFCKEYSFNVDYTASNIKITDLRTEKQVYSPGENMRFDLSLENTGLDMKDVVVNAFVEQAGTDQLTGGFPLRTLKGLTCQASYSSSLESTGIEPGDYSLVVELRDTQGILLDRRIQGFGIASDGTPPETTMIISEPTYTAASTTFLGPDTSISLVAEDNAGGSGVSSTTYRIRNDTYNSGWTAYSWSFNLTGLSYGAYSIDYNSTDFSGNQESTKTATIFLDTTPPVTTLSIGGPKCVKGTTYVTHDIQFTIQAADTGSGVQLSAYRINSTSYDSGWLTYINPFSLFSQTDGNYMIAFKSADNVDNVEVTHRIDVTLFSWNLVFTDSDGRGTQLKINTAYRLFQFTAPGKDFGIKCGDKMIQLCKQVIIINYEDKQMRLEAIATDDKTCSASACDKQTCKTYLLIEHPPAYTLTVYCKDMKGKPISSVRIYLNGYYKGKTDANGKLAIDNLLAGTYTVTARKRGYKDTNTNVTVTIDKTITITMT